MSKLADKIRRARETTITVEGHTYTVRRPTYVEAQSLGGVKDFELARRFVVGWDLSELDLGVPGGSPDPVPFDADAWEAFAADKPSVFEPIANEVAERYLAHIKAQEEAAKN